MLKIKSGLAFINRRCFFRIGGMGLALMLNACSQTSSPIHFYMLEGIEIEPSSADSFQTMSIALWPLQLPRYLNRTSIVSRTEPMVYRIDSYDRWAENPAEMLNRILPYNLQKLSGADVFLTRSSKLKRDANLQLKIQIFEFHVNESENAVLTAAWQILTPKGDTFNKTKTYHQKIETDRMEDRVKAMNETVNQMSRDIASHLTEQFAVFKSITK